MAVKQTAGRGQQGSSWESEPCNNLTISVLFRPHFLDIQKQFQLNAAVSIAVARTLQEYTSVSVHIKWPNDILLDGRKAAGILIENQLRGKLWKSAIVGVGININQTTFGEAIADRATSLKIVTHYKQEPADVLSKLCHYMDAYYDMLKNDEAVEVLEEYKKYLFGIGENRAFLINDGEEVRGEICGVSDAGRLIMLINQQRVDFGVKEIRYVF